MFGTSRDQAQMLPEPDGERRSRWTAKASASLWIARTQGVG